MSVQVFDQNDSISSDVAHDFGNLNQIENAILKDQRTNAPSTGEEAGFGEPDEGILHPVLQDQRDQSDTAAAGINLPPPHANRVISRTTIEVPMEDRSGHSIEELEFFGHHRRLNHFRNVSRDPLRNVEKFRKHDTPGLSKRPK